MKLLRGLQNPGLDGNGCVATIGNFDGVHLGHQAILAALVRKARELKLPSVVILFEPQPLEFFIKREAPARLCCFREKWELLDRLELDFVCCLSFDSRLSRLTAHEFIEQVLVTHLGVRHLVVGDDFHFGNDRQGDFSLLQRQGQKLGFSVENTETFTADDVSQQTIAVDKLKTIQRVSSTEIRNLLRDGEFERAQQYLGRPYSISGHIVHGQKLGRKIGFPTANVALNRLNVPLSGVYVIEAKVQNSVFGDRWYQGVANIGIKPTVGNHKPSLEVHLFGIDDDLGSNRELYGERMQVRFLSKIRSEKKFDGLDALTQQIGLDIDTAKRYFSAGSPSEMN